MSKAILIDFSTEHQLGTSIAGLVPIGVYLERATRGFDSLYLTSITEDSEAGHDNYVRTMEAVEEFRFEWDHFDRQLAKGVSVEELFVYISQQSYLGLRYRVIGKVEDSVTLEEAFTKYVVNQEPMTVLDDEEFVSGI